MAFIVLELSIKLAEAVQPLLGRIKARDKNLEDQIRRAVESVALNIGEGAAAVLAMVQWTMAELLRTFSSLPVAALQPVVESIVERKMPIVWEVGGRKRVLAAGLSYKEHLMLLLYVTPWRGARTPIS